MCAGAGPLAARTATSASPFNACSGDFARLRHNLALVYGQVGRGMILKGR